MRSPRSVLSLLFFVLLLVVSAVAAEETMGLWIGAGDGFFGGVVWLA